MNVSLEKIESYTQACRSTRSALAALIKKHPEAYAKAPIQLRWTEPTQREETHPDEWIEFLPTRPNRFPSLRQLSRMPHAEMDAVFMRHLTYNALVISGTRNEKFYCCDADGRGDCRTRALRRQSR